MEQCNLGRDAGSRRHRSGGTAAFVKIGARFTRSAATFGDRGIHTRPDRGDHGAAGQIALVHALDAIDDIMKDLTVPVIFITAFPERLLSGEKYEPAFLISKPYTEEQVRVAVSQAMFFASTETLRA